MGGGLVPLGVVSLASPISGSNRTGWGMGFSWWQGCIDVVTLFPGLVSVGDIGTALSHCPVVSYAQPGTFTFNFGIVTLPSALR